MYKEKIITLASMQNKKTPDDTVQNAPTTTETMHIIRNTNIGVWTLDLK